MTKGTLVRTALSLLLGGTRKADRITLSDWWAYFGSFGDDIFSDEASADHCETV